MAPDAGTDEKAHAQSVQLDLLQSPQLTLREYAQVVGKYGQQVCRFGGPELLATQGTDTELSAQFLESVSPVGFSPQTLRKSAQVAVRGGSGVPRWVVGFVVSRLQSIA